MALTSKWIAVGKVHPLKANPPTCDLQSNRDDGHTDHFKVTEGKQTMAPCTDGLDDPSGDPPTIGSLPTRTKQSNASGDDDPSADRSTNASFKFGLQLNATTWCGDVENPSVYPESDLPPEVWDGRDASDNSIKVLPLVRLGTQLSHAKWCDFDASDDENPNALPESNPPPECWDAGTWNGDDLQVLPQLHPRRVTVL